MQKWIIDKHIFASSTGKIKDIKDFKGVFFIGQKEDLKTGCNNIYIVSPKSKESVRGALYKIQFHYKVHTPILVSGKVKQLKVFLLKLLLYLGFPLNETFSIIEVTPKEKKVLTIEAKNFLLELPLYRLPNEIREFYFVNEMIKTLRKNCPWDMEQTHESLIPELIEEPLELAETIKRKDYKGMGDELGDVLLQVLFHAILGEEEGQFDLNKVSSNLFEKMYERHPHVFSNVRANNSGEVLENWEKIKKKRNNHESISKILASLITSQDIQQEARKQGFDFDTVEQIEEKIIEELKELQHAKKEGKNLSEEIGDLLFSAVNLARFLGIDPAHALFLSMEKFRKRFALMKNSGKNLKNLSSAELDNLWEKIKKDENS